MSERDHITDATLLSCLIDLAAVARTYRESSLYHCRLLEEVPMGRRLDVALATVGYPSGGVGGERPKCATADARAARVQALEARLAALENVAEAARAFRAAETDARSRWDPVDWISLSDGSPVAERANRIFDTRDALDAALAALDKGEG